MPETAPIHYITGAEWVVDLLSVTTVERLLLAESTRSEMTAYDSLLPVAGWLSGRPLL